MPSLKVSKKTLLILVLLIGVLIPVLTARPRHSWGQLLPEEIVILNRSSHDITFSFRNTVTHENIYKVDIVQNGEYRMELTGPSRDIVMSLGVALCRKRLEYQWFRRVDGSFEGVSIASENSVSKYNSVLVLVVTNERIRELRVEPENIPEKNSVIRHLKGHLT